MSTPENPFGGVNEPLDPVRVPIDTRPSVPAFVADAGVEQLFPIWSLADVLRVVVVLFLSLAFTTVLAWLFASVLPQYGHTTNAQIATDPRIIVPAQVVAYLLTVWFIFRMITVHYRQPFFGSLHWNFPRRSWPLFLAGGILLSLLLQVVSSLLPIPKTLPIDEFFKTQSGVWLMAIFGTLIAPFCEELFFRGLLYPALVRRLGMIFSLTLTAFTFALVHASQLGWSAAAVGIMFAVGLTLTLVRAYSHSLAASIIVHTGYNGLIFGLVFIQSHGFRNL